MTKKFNKRQITKIVRDYTQNNHSMMTIAVNNSTSPSIIRRILVDEQVEIRSRGRYAKEAK